MISGVEFGVNTYRFPHMPDAGFADVVEFVKKAESLDFKQVRLVDHVVGIVAERHGGIAQTPYTDKSVIRECFTLMSYLSAVTSKIRFVPAVMGIPARQTVLVAKQAAEVDIMSNGRLVMGVAVGYNPLEFEALGADFHTRGKRFEEQVEVLRRLWTDSDVTFEGQFHTLHDVSLSPRPIQRPIPLFFGMGRAIAPIPPDVVLRRVGRIADGWFPIFGPTDEGKVALKTMRDAAHEAGRDPDKIIMDVSIQMGSRSPSELRDAILAMRDFGASRITIGIEGDNFPAHMTGLDRVAELLDGMTD
jgi:probable F420-dependent oxidoreductase